MDRAAIGASQLEFVPEHADVLTDQLERLVARVDLHLDTLIRNLHPTVQSSRFWRELPRVMEKRLTYPFTVALGALGMRVTTSIEADATQLVE